MYKEEYNKYSSYIDINKEDKELKFLYKCLKMLYESHPEASHFSVEEFISFSLSKATDPKDPILASLTAQLLSVDIGQGVLLDLVTEARKRALAYELALIAVDVSEGRADSSALLDKLKEFDTVEVEEDIPFVTDNLEELYEHNVAQQGLRWRLKTLNEMLGSLRKGDFGFIFARPESGKTTFLASEVSYFAEQTDRPIIWFNNEEQGEKVSLRIYQASLGCDLATLHSNRTENQQRFMGNTGGRIKIYDSGNIYKKDVEKIVKQIQPALIIFDQIDKIKGFADDRDDLRLGTIYQWARELAKEYCPVVGVCQADGSGEGKKWLTMDNVANAKTSKQAEADWILGIGKSNDEGLDYIRYLHLSKNKLSGDTDTVAALRHGRRDVVIRPEIARYQDI